MEVCAPGALEEWLNFQEGKALCGISNEVQYGRICKKPLRSHTKETVVLFTGLCVTSRIRGWFTQCIL